MKYANKIGAAFTVVLGDNELAQNKARLKDMESGEEKEITLDDKFTGNFDSYYIDKMLSNLDTGADDLAFLPLTGEDN